MSLAIGVGNVLLATLDSAIFFASSNKDNPGYLKSIDVTNNFFRYYKSAFIATQCLNLAYGIPSGQLYRRDHLDCIIVPN